MLMATRAEQVRALAVPFAATVMMVLSGATTASAAGKPPSPPQSPPVAISGQVITVQISGSGYQGGSPGSPGSVGGGTISVSVPVPCWMFPAITGKGYYELVTSVGLAGSSPAAGYEKYKDDELGYWYGIKCAPGNWPDQTDLSGFFSLEDEFERLHPVIEYFPANQKPPDPPVPPELLREVAIENLHLPDPLLDWNPKRIGNQGTLVNMDTWFWLDSPPTTLTVNAAAGGNQASVTVTFAGMDITADGEEPLHCKDAGTPYAPGARDTTCALAFRSASSARGAQETLVTVATSWTGTWMASGADPRGVTPLSPQPDPVTATASIPVSEVQTLVTGAR
jgi:hypothetical protein